MSYGGIFDLLSVDGGGSINLEDVIAHCFCNVENGITKRTRFGIITVMNGIEGISYLFVGEITCFAGRDRVLIGPFIVLR